MQPYINLNLRMNKVKRPKKIGRFWFMYKNIRKNNKSA